MADKKDEIISMQLELIRQMTENNIRRLSTDIWGAPSAENRTSGADKGKRDRSDAAPIGNVPTGNVPTGDVPPVKASDGGGEIDPSETEEALPPKEDIAELKKELDGYIGLGSVKKEVKNLINMATVYKMRKDAGLPTADVSLHMTFSGNPGTGKTMIARFMARVYHSLGLLSKGTLTEVDRSGLVAGYVGQTALKTAKVVEEAKGGVLFIDEAYTLTSKTENDFGFEAVDTILKAMEDNRDDLVVIAAGYTDLMEEFIDSNPGLRSRFNKYVHFEDYSAEEMTAIFDLQCEKSCYQLEEDARRELAEYFAAVAAAAADAAGEFGNARGVRNVFERILTEQANRLAEMDAVTKDDLMKIVLSDVKAALYGDDANRAEDSDAGK